MVGDKSERTNTFNIASNLTADQKQRIEINLLKDEETRKMLQKKLLERDEELKQIKADQEKELKRVTEEEVRKRVKPAPAPVPIGMEDKRTVDQRIEAVKQDVASKYAEPNQKITDATADKHNALINDALKSAQEEQRKQKLTQTFNLKR